MDSGKKKRVETSFAALQKAVKAHPGITIQTQITGLNAGVGHCRRPIYFVVCTCLMLDVRLVRLRSNRLNSAYLNHFQCPLSSGNLGQRIRIDVIRLAAVKYQEMHPIMVLPAIYLFDGASNLVKMLQGEVTTKQVTDIIMPERPGHDKP